MLIPYRIIKIGSRLKYKLRHHKGHGIHSPFVFNLINDVIENKHCYYVYKDIETHLEESNIRDIDKKKHRLIFRFINRFNPIDILIIGNISELLNMYIQSVSKNIRLINNEKNAKHLPDKYSCIYINIKSRKNIKRLSITNLFNKINNQSFIIVDNIRTNKDTENEWSRMIENEKVRISLDLYHVGVLFFDTKYFKQNYKLSF